MVKRRFLLVHSRDGSQAVWVMVEPSVWPRVAAGFVLGAAVGAAAGWRR